MATKLRLFCDILHSRFTLFGEGEDFKESFDSFDDAYEQAEAHATEQTPLTLLNERGGVIMETTVFPSPDEDG